MSVQNYKSIGLSNEKSALAVNLVYVSGTEAGIKRIKKRTRFFYVYGDKEVRDIKTLERIKALVIPPAWTNVWICKFPEGHIQTTGFDLMNRKQYKYHYLWNQLRSKTKYFRLLEFGKFLPLLRLKLEKDIAGSELTEEKVIATVISLMERTYIRIGNSSYEKLYGSHGLTTLKDKHVKINGTHLNFSFKGKKGVYHDISLKNKRLARIVKQCRDIPGKELFQYKDENGEFKKIDSGKVNEYIKAATGRDFTAKEFRTWAGSLNALSAFKNIGVAGNKTALKKNIANVLDIVSFKLGNTRSVCRKYYIHPLIIEMYQDNTLQSYLAQLDISKTAKSRSGLTKSEQILMRILRKAGATSSFKRKIK